MGKELIWDVSMMMFSMDNGEHWTASQPSRFTSPNSPLSMKKDTFGRFMPFGIRYLNIMGGNQPVILPEAELLLLLQPVMTMERLSQNQ